MKTYKTNPLLIIYCVITLPVWRWFYACALVGIWMIPDIIIKLISTLFFCYLTYIFFYFFVKRFIIDSIFIIYAIDNESISALRFEKALNIIRFDNIDSVFQRKRSITIKDKSGAKMWLSAWTIIKYDELSSMILNNTAGRISNVNKKHKTIKRIFAVLFATAIIGYCYYWVFWDFLPGRDRSMYMGCQYTLFKVKEPLDKFLEEKRALKFDSKHTDPFNDGFCDEGYFSYIRMNSVKQLEEYEKLSCGDRVKSEVAKTCTEVFDLNGYTDKSAGHLRINISPDKKYEIRAKYSGRNTKCDICVTEKSQRTETNYRTVVNYMLYSMECERKGYVKCKH